MVLSERQNDLLCSESWYQDGDSYRAKAEHSVCGRNVYILCREITLTLGFRSNSTGLYISFCSWAVTMEKDPWKCRLWSTEPFPVTAFIHHDMLVVHSQLHKEMSWPHHAAVSLTVCVAETLFPTPPLARLQLLSSVELVFFLSRLQAGETRKVKSTWAVVCFNPPNGWRRAFFKHFWAPSRRREGKKKQKKRGIMCICLPVIRCISSPSFYLMIGFYSKGQYFFWSVMILHSGDLKGGKKEKRETAVILQLWTTLNLYKI